MDVKPEADAPIRLTDDLAKVTPPKDAVPLEALTGLVVAERPPETEVEQVLSEYDVRVTASVALETKLPFTSCTTTTG